MADLGRDDAHQPLSVWRAADGEQDDVVAVLFLRSAMKENVPQLPCVNVQFQEAVAAAEFIRLLAIKDVLRGEIVVDLVVVGAGMISRIRYDRRSERANVF